MQNIPVFFRKNFTLDALPTSATLYISADNTYKVFVNGVFIGEDDVWAEAENYDVNIYLNLGSNVIAIQCLDQGIVGGLIAYLSIMY